MALTHNPQRLLPLPALRALIADQRGAVTVEYTVLAAAGLVVAFALLGLGAVLYASDQTSLDALTANVP